MERHSESLILLDLKDTPDGCRVAVTVQPGARKSAFLGLHGGRLKIALQAPPVDGKANDALIGFLAREAGVARSKVTIVRGDRSRQKLLELSGFHAQDLRRLLARQGIALKSPPEKDDS
ncbi:YggU family protein [Candidatus Poribacteria bacterium]|nr:YggU family protein [Candidatus Poribacteria bacterium]